MPVLWKCFKNDVTAIISYSEFTDAIGTESMTQ